MQSRFKSLISRSHHLRKDCLDSLLILSIFSKTFILKRIRFCIIKWKKWKRNLFFLLFCFFNCWKQFYVLILKMSLTFFRFCWVYRISCSFSKSRYCTIFEWIIKCLRINFTNRSSNLPNFWSISIFHGNRIKRHFIVKIC
jgi:hypothetical protein